MTHRIAIVGTGPAGFYAAQALHRLRDFPVAVDLFDRLPTPYGLIRSGVAPDHQHIKAVARGFARTVSRAPALRFFGNVHVGRDLPVTTLAAHYDAVIWAIGCEGARTLGIRGEDLPGVWPASRFVAWYNGHPDRAHDDLDLSAVQRVIVVGNGNVALDVARVLSCDVARLAQTDVADHALQRLRESAVKEVVLLGRRGPAQAAFTLPELRELCALDGVSVRALGPQHGCSTPAHPNQKAILSLLEERRDAPLGPHRTITLRFCASPVAIDGDTGVTGVVVEDNTLVSDGDRVRPQGTGCTERLSAQLVLTAIGYRGRALPGLPFDPRRGTVSNREGRVLSDDGAPLTGQYVVGWARRGPTGVVGTNKPDAKEVVANLWSDLHTQPSKDAPDIAPHLPPSVVSWAGWERLDALERAAGQAQGRPRVKRTTWASLLDGAKAQRA